MCVGASHGIGHRQEHQPTERTLEKLSNIEGLPRLNASLIAKQPDSCEDIFWASFTKVEDSVLSFSRSQICPEKWCYVTCFFGHVRELTGCSMTCAHAYEAKTA